MKFFALAVGMILTSHGILSQDIAKVDSLKIVIEELEGRQKIIDEKLKEARDNLSSLLNHSVSSRTPVNNKPADCSKHIRFGEDKVTGDKYITSPKEPIILSKDDKNGISLYWLYSEGILVLVLKAYGGGCLDQYGKINILFRDGTRMTTTHDQEFNCDENANIYFTGGSAKTNVLDRLLEKEIEIVRIATRTGFVEEILSPQQSKNFMQSGRCIRATME